MTIFFAVRRERWFLFLMRMETTYTWTAIDDHTTKMTLQNKGNPTGFSKLFAPFMETSQRTKTAVKNGQLNFDRKNASTYPKGGVSCYADSFVIKESLYLRIKFSGKNPALRLAAKRYALCQRGKFLLVFTCK